MPDRVRSHLLSCETVGGAKHDPVSSDSALEKLLFARVLPATVLEIDS